MILIFAILLAFGVIPDEHTNTILHPATVGDVSPVSRIIFRAPGALEVSVIKETHFDVVPFSSFPHGPKAKDITGKRFGRLQVIGVAGVTKGSRLLWCARCDCGQLSIIRSYNKSLSCGCLHVELTVKASTTHGFAGRGVLRKSEYKTWASMKSRCFNRNEEKWGDYGGRGITVCDRWKDSFENFLADMGPRPSPKHSIDRINNDGNYEPGNCRWATRKEQMNNTSRNRRISFNGETLTLAQWAAKLGISGGTILFRIKKGWPLMSVLNSSKRVNQFG